MWPTLSLHCFWLLSTLLLSSSAFDDDRPIVKTSLGPVRGIWMFSELDKKYAGFLGVPFARPPIGELRFLPPEPARPWLGEWDASLVTPRCITWDHIMAPFDTLNVKGHEDCLYLNIYTPEAALPNGDVHKRDVIVWFHAGAFMFGGALEYGAKKLIDRNVILITVNYRLGPLGFLSLENDVLPGNNGLRDQTMALQWVHDHIDSFGGNPRAVTLMGMSAGGSSVHYHFLSPLSRGLFNGGVSLSGTALCRWALTEASKEKARQLAASLGCTQRAPRELVECLRQRPAHAIVAQVEQFQIPGHYWPFSPFGPVVERRDQLIPPFLPDTPINMLARGEFSTEPWITGVTESEGLYPAAQFIENPKLMQWIWDEFEDIAPHLLDYNYTLTPDQRSKVTEVIKQRLGPLDHSAAQKLIQLISERHFFVDAQRAAELQARHSPVWFYFFKFRGRQSLSDLLSGNTHNYGTSHGDDISYFLNVTFVPDMGLGPRQGEEALVQKQMLEYWTSFARHGEPRSVTGGKWDRIIPGGDMEYLEISGSPAKMKTTSDLGDAEFWEALPFEERTQSLGPQKYEKDEL